MNNYNCENFKKLLVKKKANILILKIIKNIKSNKNLKNSVISFLTKKQILDQIEQAKNNSNQKKFALKYIPYVIKDNICTKNILTTAGCKILDNYYPVFNADVITSLNQEKAILIGKANMDELGMGGTGLSSALKGEVGNYFNSKRISGGSSSGCAVLVASKLVPFAIATDSGDSIRKPAGYNGVIGFKPTYGVISRYGVIDFAPSLDTVGIFSQNIVDLEKVFIVLAKKSKNDLTTIDLFLKNNKTNSKIYKIVILKETLIGLNPKIKKIFLAFIKRLDKEKNINIKIISFDLNLLKVLLPIYYIISSSEALSCHYNLTGITFGRYINKLNWKDSVFNTRSKNIGFIPSGRYLFGQYVTKNENYESYFLKARKVRRKINNNLNLIFKENDLILMPNSSNIAPKIKDVKLDKLNLKNKNIADNCLLLANFFGMPSITMPLSFVKKMPIAINLNAKPKNDFFLINFAKQIEKIINFEEISKKFYE